MDFLYHWLDLYDGKHKPDHGKVMGLLAFLAFLVLALLHKLPDFSLTALLLCSVYGARVLLAGMKILAGVKVNSADADIQIAKLTK